MKISALISILFFVFAASTFAQNRCFTEQEAKKVIETIRSPKLISENNKIRKELLDMREEREKLNAKISEDVEKNRNLVPEANLMGERHFLRVCQLIKENGWLTKKVVNEDGFQAMTFLIANNKAYQLQREMLPVLVEAAKKGYIGNPLLASMVDSIRVGAGLPQIFGTQAAVRNDVIYLNPLLNDEKVDDWRKIYDLPPLAVQIRGMEGRYFMPVLKTQRSSPAPNLNRKNNDQNSDTAILGISDDETEVLKIDTKLVNLNVRVLTQDSKVPADLKLTKEDFAVFEDGAEQQVDFFSAVEQPFDLVLLLDFSGSTRQKQELIKKAAQRFVEYARPADRIAVVVFATDIVIVADFTTDKNSLTQKIKAIDIDGGSPIWDALKFTYENLIKKESAGRRSAVVFMTDGEDSSRETIFADLLETVRRGETTIFPVYLDKGRALNEWSRRYRQMAQKYLWILAEESGGQVYKAEDVKDLSGIYEQVIGELGKVYSIGYEPKNENRDGGWRALTVKIKNHPELIARTRKGYYAR